MRLDRCRRAAPTVGRGTDRAAAASASRSEPHRPPRADRCAAPPSDALRRKDRSDRSTARVLPAGRLTPRPAASRRDHWNDIEGLPPYLRLSRSLPLLGPDSYPVTTFRVLAAQTS